jgi:hemerythrin
VSIDLGWDSKFEIGHERIDFEHRIFLGLIRDLSAEVEKDVDSERIGRILREIVKYAEFHFVSEENIMTDISYPDLVEHRCHHEMLLAQLADRIQGYRVTRELPDAIVSFLFQWFALHTSQEDKKIAQFVKAPA